MGSEFAQRREWSHDRSLDWHLLDGNFQENAPHRGMQQLVRDLNHVATRVAALHALDDDSAGFEWVDADGESHCIFAFLRKCHGSTVLAVCNMTPTLHADFCIGVPGPGLYRELINTDGSEYGGSGVGNLGAVSAQPVLSHGREWSLQIIVPPLATLIFELENS
jgi:1,4-alpha-glucan branching enzyme